MRYDFVVLQSDRHFCTESLGWRFRMVRPSFAAGAEPLSEWRMVPVLQGKTRAHAGQLRRVHRLVYQIVEKSKCMVAVSSSLLLGIDVDALRIAAME